MTIRNKGYINKIILFSIFFLLTGTYLIADNSNVMQIHNVSGEPSDTVTVDVEIINDDPFVAFQFDLPLSEQLTYLPNSAQLTSRSVDHIIIANIVNNNTLRIFAYSPTNTAFTGNSGNVAYFELIVGCVPGNYSLNMNSPIIGDSNSANILTGTINGTFTILAPDINLNTNSLNFGRTPLGSHTDRTFTIYNLGNQSLQINDINIDNPYFTVVGDTTFSISASGQQTITVRFNSIIKGTYDNQLTIISDDPDEPNVNIKLHAIAFAVNELHIGNMFAFSGDTVRLYCSINNMEPFVGFQFDLLLPEPMTYIEGSAQLTERAVDHIVSANMIGEGSLRVVAYSPSNTAFSDTLGNIVYMDFFIEGTGGYYSLNAVNVIIGDAAGDNILSDYYNGQLQIAAADIYGPGSLNFGEISLLDTLQLLLDIGNNGNDTLVIDQIVFTDTSFWTTIALPQSVIPSQQLSPPVYFSNILEGNYQGIMRIYSNDPDESPFDVTLQGITFSPNYIIVKDTTATPGDTVLVKIDVDNYDEFVAFQFDLNFSDMLTYIDNSAQLTDRAQDHILIESLLDSTDLRIIVYSMSQSPFLGNSGTVLTIQFIVDENCPSANLALILSNAILGDANSNNILRDVQNGEIEIIASVQQTIELIAGWNMISFYNEPEDMDMQSIMQPLIDAEVLVKVQNESGLALVYLPGVGWYNGIGDMANTEGYYINVNDATQLETLGHPVVLPIAVPLISGWNMMSYPVMSSQNAQTVVQPLIDADSTLVKVENEVGHAIVYLPDYGWYNGIGDFLPGEGYYINVNADDTLTITEPVILAGKPEKPGVISHEGLTRSGCQHFIPVYQGNGYNNMTLLINSVTIDEVELEVGDEVGIYDGDVCVGACLIIGEKNKLIQMAASADDPLAQGVIDGFIDGHQISYRFWDSSESVEITDIEPTYIIGDGTFSQLGTAYLELAGSSLGIGDIIPEVTSLGISYPNPFNAQTTIKFSLKEECEVKIEIYNIKGQKVKTLVNEKLEPKIYTVIWDGKDSNNMPVSNGIYFYKMRAKSYASIKKVLLMR